MLHEIMPVSIKKLAMAFQNGDKYFGMRSFIFFSSIKVRKKSKFFKAIFETFLNLTLFSKQLSVLFQRGKIVGIF